MRKLRERLSSKKGFTLVELIVVIVIILILAAVLIPNVMRYIGQARESAFQSEASGYMTELEGYVAEHYAKFGEDLKPGNFAAEAADSDTAGDNRYAVTAFGEDNKVKTVGVYDATRNINPPEKQRINLKIDKGAILEFNYDDGTYNVSWTQSEGWGNVQKNS